MRKNTQAYIVVLGFAGFMAIVGAWRGTAIPPRVEVPVATRQVSFAPVVAPQQREVQLEEAIDNLNLPTQELRRLARDLFSGRLQSGTDQIYVEWVITRLEDGDELLVDYELAPNPTECRMRIIIDGTQDPAVVVGIACDNPCSAGCQICVNYWPSDDDWTFIKDCICVGASCP